MHPTKKAILISLGIGVILMLAKFVAFFITHSNAILTDALESIVNVLASGFAFYSIYLSTLPKDENHPYGHGKVEYFSAFIEGILIFIAGIIIFFKSGYDLFFPSPIIQLLDGAFIIAGTGIVNCIIGFYLIRVGKKHFSITLEADGKHLLTDALTSAGLFLGILLIYFTQIMWLDSIISLMLSMVIMYNGYRLLRRSIGGLMDESNLELVKEVIAILSKNRQESWIDIHNLRTQQYGPDIHVDCHVTLPYYYDLNQVHHEISNIDKLINSHANRKTEFFIHADPCIPACCHYCKMSACPVRQQAFQGEIVWTMENVTKNQKHFDL
ncbi:MAG: cation transporter [Pedobacter sp.]|nr:MAG: cation transporter [Pedobacter sp.]